MARAMGSGFVFFFEPRRGGRPHRHRLASVALKWGWGVVAVVIPTAGAEGYCLTPQGALASLTGSPHGLRLGSSTRVPGLANHREVSPARDLPGRAGGHEN